MNFFPGNPTVHLGLKKQRDLSLKSMDLFPKFVNPSSKMYDGTEEPKTAQMTIFYAGQMFVFNDFPADRAKEVMLLASKGNKFQASTHQPALAPKIRDNETESSQRDPPAHTISNKRIQDHLQLTVEPIASDLPIARRKSLHRFLEKRKDRITSKAPYTVAASLPPSKAAETKSWLSLASLQ
ncbi:hypothetical protein SAY87_029589 [Trapa incisa]|uniref:Protein TIFY n=1 Tax=Trapa incisa TaxID=236973 RepID=A0AAN7QDA6_9MYRT|nr:hypothetical protein SAY87_029589 [Trapa incisa]